MVFDTNAYRNLTFGLTTDDSRKIARKLADTELSCGIKALANPFVIWELVAHLADSSDSAYENCMNSVVALVEHTRQPNDDSGGVSRIADGETEICLQLFRKLPPNAEHNSKNLCVLASYVWKEAPILSNPNVQTNFQAFLNEMDKLEAKWLDHVEALLSGFRSIDASVTTLEAKKTRIKKTREYLNGPGFFREIAIGKAINCANLLGITPSTYDKEVLGDRMESIFSTSLKLMQKTFASWFDAPDMNLRNSKKKRGNFIWDTAICYGIGHDHAVDDAKITYVTDDGAIYNTAIEVGCKDRVQKFCDYVKSIAFTFP